MRIVFNQDEILEAVEKLVLDQVVVPDDMRMDITLKATRGEEGYTAEIDIVADDAPHDGSDRTVDDRIEPKAGAETLGIGEKVLAAKADASKPRRRGRPAGAKNVVKLVERPEPEPGTEHRDLPAPDQAEQEPAQELQDEPAAPEVTEETSDVTDASSEPEIAPAGDEIVDHTGEEPDVEDTETATDVNEVDDNVEIETPETEQVEEAAEEAASDPAANEAEPASGPAATVEAADISGQANEELAANVSEPEPEPEVTPEPEAQPEKAPAPAAPTKSLFANIQRNNG